jgi:two-component system alkaline phosphatase synthesis response regulator PhoP
MKPRILFVEDDPGLVMAMVDLLNAEGYDIQSATTGNDGLKRALTETFDLVILDVMLPEKSGFDVCRDLRQQGVNTPIIMLTARGELTDKVVGLKLGADDYLTKPFEPLELLARIEAQMRRRNFSTLPPSGAFRFGSVTVDFRSTEVRRGGRPVDLSAREFQLLRHFIQQCGTTLTREALLRDVWGYEAEIFTRTVDMHVSSLRQKLEPDAKNPRHFITMRGHGYKFVG